MATFGGGSSAVLDKPKFLSFSNFQNQTSSGKDKNGGGGRPPVGTDGDFGGGGGDNRRLTP